MRFSSAIAANGALFETPITSKPSGSRVTRSPWLIHTGYLRALLPHALEQRGVLHHLDLGAAEFAVMPALDLAAELRRHRLLAVADAEHRHAGIENRLRGARRRRFGHRGGAAGEDHAARLHRGEGFSRLLERDDLAIDPLLAHAPGDELGDLGAEIDDENLVVGCHGEQLADRPGGRNRLSHSYLLFEL